MNDLYASLAFSIPVENTDFSPEETADSIAGLAAASAVFIPKTFLPILPNPLPSRSIPLLKAKFSAILDTDISPSPADMPIADPTFDIPNFFPIAPPITDPPIDLTVSSSPPEEFWSLSLSSCGFPVSWSLSSCGFPVSWSF